MQWRLALMSDATNAAARAFWSSVGFREYALTLELEPHHPRAP